MTKMMSELPKELLEEILARAPVQSTRAVRLTCKQWNTLSKEESFTKKHLVHVKAVREFMVVIVMDFKVCLMSINLHGIRKEEDVESSIECKGILINLIDASEVYHSGGLLLSITKDHTRLVVWNSYWGQTRWIEPRIRSIPVTYAIGYETRKSSRSYKLLSCVVSTIAGNCVEYSIYQLDSNSWGVLDVPCDWATDVYRHGGVSVNGNTYWYTPEGNMGEFLICFDFTRERFGPALPLPFDSNCKDKVALTSVREEQLAVLFMCQRISRIEIWITNKIEPNDVTWRKLFLAVDMKPLCSLLSDPIRHRSFFVDEEEKFVVLFGLHEETVRVRNIAYIIGENGYFRKVDLGESAHGYCLPVGCSYVPSSVQIKQLINGKSS
ncbi:hypothetical protein CARUB_v10016436mg [Capsella rubella]|uniref:F-box domain-containing protein n=1 Tax=Capsella rubella TaxID=81985 RepID=R0I9A8_9BRAS|nr:putative F-box/kelch-repeat protein At3g16880 [Capsella rubella]EOA33098.1 hypothetical protein CARUB_v10016436mg [Capsella rubella]